MTGKASHRRMILRDERDRPYEGAVNGHDSPNEAARENGNSKLLDAKGKTFEELVKIGLRTPPPKPPKPA